MLPDLNLVDSDSETETTDNPPEGLGSPGPDPEPIRITSSLQGQAFPTQTNNEANSNLDQLTVPSYLIARDPPCSSFTLNNTPKIN